MPRAAALVVVRPGATRCEMLIHYEQQHVKWGAFSGKAEPRDAGARDTAMREFEEEWRLATGLTLPASTVTIVNAPIRITRLFTLLQKHTHTLPLPLSRSDAAAPLLGAPRVFLSFW